MAQIRAYEGFQVIWNDEGPDETRENQRIERIEDMLELAEIRIARKYFY